SFTPGKEGEKVIVKIVLNPQAKFNDGTPIDVKALQATWKTQQKADGEYNIVASDIYGYVESVEAEEDNFHVKVTFSKPFYPLNALFTFILHPALEDPKVFNEGFVDNLHPEWGCGPFTINDGGFNSSEKTVTVVPNDKWWGDKPVLEKIIFRQMDEPAKKAAFKNDEIDAAAAGTASAYSEFKAVAGTELHKGVRLHVSGIDVNPRRVKDAAVRKAIFYGLDREALAKIRYQGLPYEEEIPGSMLHMPFSEYYQDAFPKVEGSPKDAIKKVLEDAGYTKDGEFYAKDGQQIHYKIVIFGDDPVDKGMAQTFTRNMKEAGLNIEVDQHPEGDFGRVLGNWEYDITFAGYEANNPDATVATQQFFHSSNSDGIGSPEIDAMIDEMLLIEDDKERNLKCDEIEKKHTAELAFLGCAANGPHYVFTKKGLANYGAFLFKTIDWTKVGWVK
ncbi:MAG: ABC transporter family substrate-binding protein, partial [Rothia dentocariosa]